MPVSIVIPMLNEAAALPLLAPVVARLDPPPAQVLCVDGGSMDGSRDLARQYGWDVLECEAGRGRQINAGVQAARGDMVLVLHADTYPPADAMTVIVTTLADRGTALAGFTPVIKGPDKTRWGTTAHNWAKTWYAPLVFRPHLFVRGLRLLFGDHGMFFRRADFLACGGCDPAAKVLEEADLCIRMMHLGRIRLVPRVIETSDRRVAQWGALKANWIYLKVGVMWAVGARQRLDRFYPDVR
jgi:GT2 family glycosyltransferase